VHSTQQYLRSKGDGRDVVGIVVEGLVKGTRKRDSAGVKRQSSALIYGYVKRGDGFIIRDNWSHTWRKGFEKVLISNEMDLFEWIDGLPEEVLQSTIAVVPPLLADYGRVESVLCQVSQRSIDMARRAHSNSQTLALDELFPQNFSACHEYDDCAFIDACFSPAVAESPLESGLYVPRIPNHTYETEVS
jgi:hypothetical protein